MIHLLSSKVLKILIAGEKILGSSLEIKKVEELTVDVKFKTAKIFEMKSEFKNLIENIQILGDNEENTGQ
jgi:hypothetical protein